MPVGALSGCVMAHLALESHNPLATNAITFTLKLFRSAVIPNANPTTCLKRPNNEPAQKILGRFTFEEISR